MVAGLEVNGQGRVWVGLQVHGEYLQGYVVVVELVVAHGHVHIEREVVAFLGGEGVWGVWVRVRVRLGGGVLAVRVAMRGYTG